MINECINELVAYGLKRGLVDPADEVYVTNRLLELFRLTEHDGVVEQVQPRKLSQILNDMLEYAYQQGMLEEQTVTEKDLFDTKIMGELTPPPSVVRRQFFEKYNISPKTATDFYYQFSQATNYIRTDRIAKDEKWAADTEFSDFWTAYKKGPFHICEVVCFFSIQFSQIVLLARLCMIYMLKVSFIES